MNTAQIPTYTRLSPKNTGYQQIWIKQIILKFFKSVYLMLNEALCKEISIPVTKRRNLLLIICKTSYIFSHAGNSGFT